MQGFKGNIVLFPHVGSGNHGCEAIVRTTIELLGKDNSFILFSDDIEEDRKYIKNFNHLILTPRKKIKRCSFKYLKAVFYRYILRRNDVYDVLAFDPVISSCSKGDILLSIGGDNYCYGDNNYLYLVNYYARKNGCKTVLWSCSIGKENLTDRMRQDLIDYDLIIARESISYENLKKINSNTVLVPDPAFVLQKSESILPLALDSRPYIGINISPMIKSKETINGITIKNYEYLIRKILSETDFNIALIPHVVKKNSDDRIAINEVLEHFSEENRIYIIDDQNCRQLKEVISKCVFFIGARTHATIAAYSTYVPTLVVGYSVKAKGIAKDLFGTYEKYVLPVQDLKKENDLYESFCTLWYKRDEIKEHLKLFMPQYIKSIYKITEVLEKGLAKK